MGVSLLLRFLPSSPVIGYLHIRGLWFPRLSWVLWQNCFDLLPSGLLSWYHPFIYWHLSASFTPSPRLLVARWWTGWMRACVLSLQTCLTLCNPMDHSSPGFSVHGILQASILEWVAMSSSRGSVFCGSCIAGRFLTHWTTWEAWTHEYLLQIPLLANDHSCPRIYSSVYLAINPSAFLIADTPILCLHT